MARHSRSQSRSRSPSEERVLPYNAKSISESDYFHKNDEFRVWLKDEKGKYFDELSSDKARSYFRKFVKAWNRGRLFKYLYAGVDQSDVPQTTSYKWSFAKSASEDKGKGRSHNDVPRSSASSSARVQGPTLPSSADLALAHELEAEERERDRSHKRKRERKEDKERIEDMVGPKEVGREGQLEKKRARRDNDRAFREKGDEGLEADEGTLMGGGDSFQARIARRDAAKRRYEQKNEEKIAAARERSNAIKDKESATMAMFQEMAKQRFG